MTNETEKPIIIIRRIKRVKGHGHHGGSWKIAYADFVTAMMAFFLLMWLLGLMNKYQLEGVAEYFKKPLKEAFIHESDRRGLDVRKDKADNKEKFKEKNKEKNTEKNTQKEKPNQVDIKSQNDKQQPNVAEGKVSDKALTQQQIETIKGEIVNKMQSDPVMRQFQNQLNFEVTADGLKITLHDLENKQMFTTGKADFEAYAKKIVSWLSKELNTYPNHIMIIGHTDVLPYDSKTYSNWELSADRANAARRALVKYGLNEDKIIRVIGVADTQLLDKENGLDPKNRRIEIIVLTDDAMKKLISN